MNSSYTLECELHEDEPFPQIIDTPLARQKTILHQTYKALECIKQDNGTNKGVQHPLAPEKVKNFLLETLHSNESEQPYKLSITSLIKELYNRTPRDEYFQKNTKQIEKHMLKQQFLENNKLFDPTEYFGGLNITDLSQGVDDRRLDAMFLEYVPTEQEENVVGSEQKILQQDDTIITTTNSNNNNKPPIHNDNQLFFPSPKQYQSLCLKDKTKLFMKNPAFKPNNKLEEKLTTYSLIPNKLPDSTTTTNGIIPYSISSFSSSSSHSHSSSSLNNQAMTRFLKNDKQAMTLVPAPTNATATTNTTINTGINANLSSITAQSTSVCISNLATGANGCGSLGYKSNIGKPVNNSFSKENKALDGVYNVQANKENISVLANMNMNGNLKQYQAQIQSKLETIKPRDESSSSSCDIKSERLFLQAQLNDNDGRSILKKGKVGLNENVNTEKYFVGSVSNINPKKNPTSFFTIPTTITYGINHTKTNSEQRPKDLTKNLTNFPNHVMTTPFEDSKNDLSGIAGYQHHQYTYKQHKTGYPSFTEEISTPIPKPVSSPNYSKSPLCVKKFPNTTPNALLNKEKKVLGNGFINRSSLNNTKSKTNQAASINHLKMPKPFSFVDNGKINTQGNNTILISKKGQDSINIGMKSERSMADLLSSNNNSNTNNNKIVSHLVNRFQHESITPRTNANPNTSMMPSSTNFVRKLFPSAKLIQFIQFIEYINSSASAEVLSPISSLAQSGSAASDSSSGSGLTVSGLGLVALGSYLGLTASGSGLAALGSGSQVHGDNGDGDACPKS